MAIISQKKSQYNELQVIKDGYLLRFVSLQGSTLPMKLDNVAILVSAVFNFCKM
jgi:hypothetical protein